MTVGQDFNNSPRNKNKRSWFERIGLLGSKQPRNRYVSTPNKFKNANLNLVNTVVELREKPYIIETANSLRVFLNNSYDLGLDILDSKFVRRLARSTLDKGKLTLIIGAVIWGTLTVKDVAETYKLDRLVDNLQVEQIHDSQAKDKQLKRNPINLESQNVIPISAEADIAKDVKKAVIENPSNSAEVKSESEFKPTMTWAVDLVERLSKNRMITHEDERNIQTCKKKYPSFIPNIKNSGIRKSMEDVSIRIENKSKALDAKYRVQNFLSKFSPDIKYVKERVRNLSAALSPEFNGGNYLRVGEGKFIPLTKGQYVIDYDRINPELPKILVKYAKNGVPGYPQAKFNPFLALAFCLVESNGGEDKVSPKGARGPMQVLPETRDHYYKSGQKWSYVTAAFPHIYYTAKELNVSLDRVSAVDIGTLAAAYNAGIGNFREKINVLAIDETDKYVKIMSSLAKLCVFKVGDEFYSANGQVKVIERKEIKLASGF
ncbi:hypothetical protein BVX95_01870 [archaeon D22]|nr:hypothetical protein BVX95_01870 [archaeon D22]